MKIPGASLFLMLGLWTMLPVVACRAPGSAAGDAAPRQRLEALYAKLQAGEVERVEILHIPDDVDAVGGFTPEALEQQYFSKVTIRRFPRSPHQAQLAKAVKATVLRSTDGVVDLRWALILYGPRDSRVGAAYIERSGRRGVVEGETVIIEGDLVPWVRGCLASSLR
jgi:hypothetical protein